MPVVINDFEVVETPQAPQAQAPQAAPPEPAQLPEIELERTLALVMARLERVYGPLEFCGHQLIHGLAAQVLDLLYARQGIRNPQIRAEATHLDDVEQLVVGAFPVELHLTVLIRGPKGLDRGLPGEDLLLIQREALAETLRP